VVSLGDSGTIVRAIDMYDGILRHGGTPSARATTRIYELLLAEAMANVPTTIDHLVIVADGALHRMPFAALGASRPLVETHMISVVPSARLWLKWRETGRAGVTTPDRPAIVLADPHARPEGIDDLPDLLRLAPTLTALPWTRREAEAVAAQLGDGTLVRSGAEATRKLLDETDVGRFAIVHLAAHAIVDEHDPERSGVLLAPGDGHDGLMRMREIVKLDLDGRAVILAACSSASGLMLRGEGPMSLARAFFQAGATTVVASLWPLRDDVAARLFEDVYRELARGRSVAHALAAVQRDRIAAGSPPQEWAGLVVLGDGAHVPIPPTAQRRIGVWAALAALMLAVVAGVFFRIRRPAS
jgi:CHAT domain-containing protein